MGYIQSKSSNFIHEEAELVHMTVSHSWRPQSMTQSPELHITTADDLIMSNAVIPSGSNVAIANRFEPKIVSANNHVFFAVGCS